MKGLGFIRKFFQILFICLSIVGAMAVAPAKASAVDPFLPTEIVSGGSTFSCWWGGTDFRRCVKHNSGRTYRCVWDSVQFVWHCYPYNNPPGNGASQFEADVLAIDKPPPGTGSVPLPPSSSQVSTQAPSVSPIWSINDPLSCYYALSISVPRGAVPRTVVVNWGNGYTTSYSVSAGIGVQTNIQEYTYPGTGWPNYDPGYIRKEEYHIVKISTTDHAQPDYSVIRHSVAVVDDSTT